MSTRSILALQKGRHVRYCFLHWDGDNHGQTLKDMLDSEIEELYNAMAPIDEGKYLFLDHLHPQSYWDSYLEYQKADWSKRFGNRMKDFEAIYMRPQSTAYLPVIPTVEKGQKVVLDPDEIGSYDTLATSPRSVKECLHGNREFDWCEYVWHYNLDTRVITYFTHKTENAPWSPQTMKRRRRFTPMKFDFSWIGK